MNTTQSSGARTRRVPNTRIASIEPLEARIAPAFTLTLSFDASVGVSSSSAGGTTTFTATATGANLSWLDIAIAMAGGANVVVKSGDTGAEAGNILDLIAANKSISNATGTSLTFSSGTGANLVGDISLGKLTLSGTNSALTVSAQHDLSLTGVGDASHVVANGTLTAATGAISDTAKIFATNLSANASTGIGSAVTPFLTQVGNLVAKTASGGIFVTNTGALNVGYAGAPFQGVKVTGGSGNIQITNDATISIIRPGDAISAPGNVTITANGATSNIATDGDNMPAVASTNQGLVSLVAGQDLMLGGAGPASRGDVSSAGGGNAAISLNAGRDIIVNGGTSVILGGGSTGAGITASATRDISILSSGPNVSQFSSGSGSAGISLSAGNVFTASVGGANTAVVSGGGSITVAANDMAISSLINAGTGTVTLQQASATSRAIDLGLGTTAGALGLSAAELNLVTAGALRIGRTDNSGNLSVTSPVTPALINTLTLRTGGSILDGTASEQADLIVANLTLQAGTQIGGSAADRLDFDATTLNASTTTTGGQRIFLHDVAGGVSVSSIDGSGGNTAVFLSADNGSITSATVNGTADIVGSAITLSVTGATGKIGSDAANPLEVNATTSLSATTGGLAGNDIFLTDTTGGASIGSINAGLANVTLSALNGSIDGVTFEPVPVADVTGGVVTVNVTGASSHIGTGNTALQVQAGTLNASSQGGNIALQQATGTVAIGQVNAGAGNVTLLSAGGPITSLTPNDGIAEAIGNVVTLTVTAPSNGNTGQIGFFTSSAQFFEVDAGTLNASTNNSRLWIRDVGAGPTAGIAIGSVNAGTNTVFLQVANGGSMTSANLDGTPDIVADTINLRALNGGSIGTSAASPVEVNATNLSAAVLLADGGVHVKDTTGGVNVTLAQTVNGSVDLEAAGATANLTLTSVIAPANTVTLQATGAVNDAGAATAVTAQTVTIVAGTGVGTTTPLDVSAANLSATVQLAGNLNVSNTGSDLNVTLAQTSNGDIHLTGVGAAANLTLTTVSAAGHTVTLTAPGVVNGIGAGSNVVTADTLVITAGSGIGTVDPLEIDTANLNATVQSAGDLRVKDTAGGLNVTQAIASDGNIDLQVTGDLTLGNVSAVGHTATLQATGAVNGATPGATAVTASTVAITAGSGVGAVDPLGIDAANLGAIVQSAGDLRVKDTAGGLNVVLAQVANGNVSLEAAGSAADLTLTDVHAVGHVVTLTATGAVNSAVAGAAAVTSDTVAITAGTGVGTVNPLEIDAANLNATVQLAGGMHIKDTAATVNVTLAQTFDGNINLEAAGTNANLVLTSINAVGRTVTLQSTGSVTDAVVDIAAVTANDLLITASTGIGTASGVLDVDVAVLAATVQLAGDIYVKDAAGGLDVALAQTSNGAISLETSGVAADLTLTNVSATGHMVTLKATGAVNGDLFDGNAEVTSGSLAISAGAGIGTANALETAVGSLAFTNAGGAVSISNAGSLTIASVGGLMTSANSGTTTSLTTSGSLTFAVNTSSQGALTATVTEKIVATSGVDNLVVNAGVTLSSQSDIVLNAGDDVTINATGALSAGGAISIQVDAGNNDVGAGGVATLNGTVTGTSITVTGDTDDDVFLTSADATAETFNGGAGFDTYRALGISGDVVVTNSGITSTALGNDGLTNIERVDLAGDSGPNTFDATGFAGLAVLSGGGGEDTLLGAEVLIQPLDVTFADVDGDMVTAKFSKGSLDFSNLRFEANASGIQLQTINLLGNTAFEGSSLTITTKHGPTGDGFVNIGAIDAAGVNLGKVRIAGDLGRINAGTGDTKTAAISSLTVSSLGALGVSGQGPDGSLQSSIIGRLGSLTVRGDIAGATINVTNGGIGEITVLGDLIGGADNFSGAILASGKVGNVVIRGTMFGGTGNYSGSIVSSDGASIGNVNVGSILGGASAFNGIFSGGTLGKVRVAGSVSGSESFAATISAMGTMSPNKPKQATAIKGLAVGGSVRFANVLAGYTTGGGEVNADVQIGPVSVGSNWIASNIAAGVAGVTAGGFSTADPLPIPGGSGDIISKIATIAIKGAAFGTIPTGDHFGFVAEEIGRLRIGATTFPLERGAHNDLAGFAIGSSHDLFVREV
jgi:hypothetical protein